MLTGTEFSTTRSDSLLDSNVMSSNFTTTTTTTAAVPSTFAYSSMQQQHSSQPVSIPGFTTPSVASEPSTGTSYESLAGNLVDILPELAVEGQSAPLFMQQQQQQQQRSRAAKMLSESPQVDNGFANLSFIPDVTALVPELTYKLHTEYVGSCERIDYTSTH
jgi:hypothetical protein